MTHNPPPPEMEVLRAGGVGGAPSVTCCHGDLNDLSVESMKDNQMTSALACHSINKTADNSGKVYLARLAKCCFLNR